MTLFQIKRHPVADIFNAAYEVVGSVESAVI